MIHTDAISSLHLLPTNPISVFPCTPSTQSTLSPAASIEQSPSRQRPALEAPFTHFMIPIIKIYTEMETLGQEELKICGPEVKDSLNRLMALDKEKIALLSQMHQEMASKKTWSTFETLVQYVGSASSIILGASILASAPIAASFLIASGGLGLINRAISDTVGWDWLIHRFTASIDLQNKITNQLDSCLSSVSTALAICGAIGAYQSNAWDYLAINPREIISNQALQSLSFSIGAVQSVARIRISLFDRKIHYLKSDIKTMDTNTYDLRQKIPQATENLKKLLEISEKLSEIIKHSIQSESR